MFAFVVVVDKIEIDSLVDKLPQSMQRGAFLSNGEPSSSRALDGLWYLTRPIYHVLPADVLRFARRTGC